ncbi:hypothetical protein Ancab_011781 [Ancistrocladus abbreviatus]
MDVRIVTISREAKIRIYKMVGNIHLDPRLRSGPIIDVGLVQSLGSRNSVLRAPCSVLRAETRNPLTLCPSRLTRSRHTLCAPSSGLISGFQRRQPAQPHFSSGLHFPLFVTVGHLHSANTTGQSVTAAQHHRSASAMAHKAGMFVVPQTIGHVLCPKCGILMTTNAANMCVKCLASEVDITDGLQKHVSIIFCPDCKRYLQPPKCWIKAERES